MIELQYQDYRSQIQTAIALTEKYSALRTQEALRLGLCYRGVLDIAKEEVGLTRLIEILEEVGHPRWASESLEWLTGFTRGQRIRLGDVVMTSTCRGHLKNCTSRVCGVPVLTPEEIEELCGS